MRCKRCQSMMRSFPVDKTRSQVVNVIRHICPACSSTRLSSEPISSVAFIDDSGYERNPQLVGNSGRRHKRAHLSAEAIKPHG